MINERQRQAYLETMGVDSYFPRMPLPAAKPSEECLLPELDEIPLENAAASLSALLGSDKTDDGKTAEAVPAVPEEDVKAMLAEIAPADSAVAVKASTATPEIVPEFNLSVVIPESGLIIVDDGMDAMEDTADYLCLMQNIVFALGLGVQRLYIERFDWPMVRNIKVDQGESAARQTLQAFVMRQREQLAADTVLVMGASAHRYLLGDDVAAEQMLSVDFPAGEYLITISAQDLLQQPQKKAHLWAQLQVLIAKLAA